MKVSEFFDPRNPEHIKAWEYLHEKGMWPASFYNQQEFDPEPLWTVEIVHKIARAYIEDLKAQEPCPGGCGGTKPKAYRLCPACQAGADALNTNAIRKLREAEARWTEEGIDAVAKMQEAQREAATLRASLAECERHRDEYQRLWHREAEEVKGLRAKVEALEGCCELAPCPACGNEKDAP